MKQIMNSKTSDNLAVVTGQMGIHRIVDHYNPKLKYLTVPEICVLYPELVPLTGSSNQFESLNPSKVKNRIKQRLGTDDIREVLFSSKIDQVFIMSNVFNHEANL